MFSLYRFQSWVQLPVGLLIVFLQRTPAVRVAATVVESVLRSPSADILKGLSAVAAAFGAVQTVAGATQFTATPSASLTYATGGSAAAVFNLTGAQGGGKPGSWQVTAGSLPPGAFLAATNTATTGSTTTAVNVATTGATAGNLYLLGTLTTPGTYTFSLTAWERINKGGDSAGPYSVTVTVSGAGGGGGGGGGAPTLSEQPAASISTPVSSALSLSVTATGTGLSYQWFRSGIAIVGATSATYTEANATALTSGVYQVVVTNTAGSVASNPTVVSVTGLPPSTSTFYNLSTNTYVQGTLTVGFVILGTQPKRVLVRAAGPGLSSVTNGAIPLSDVLSDPELSVFDQSSTRIAYNDNWPEGLAPSFSAAGAFAYVANSKDASLVLTLTPGNYTATVSNKGGGNGKAIIEVYQLD